MSVTVVIERDGCNGSRNRVGNDDARAIATGVVDHVVEHARQLEKMWEGEGK